jgi:Calcineurin-like phosphoesterase
MNTTSGLRDAETTLFQKRLARGDFLRLVGAGMGISLVPPLVASVGAQSALGVTATEPSLTLVSIPDFVNVDVGDVSGIQGDGYLGWDPGDPNSINSYYRDTLKVILDQVASENPDAVLVAGDEVNGHWGYADTDGTGVFGPLDTYEHKLQAIRNAGALYYQQWKLRFARRGLTVYPAVGDHEIGDNPWTSGTFKFRAFGTFKSTWAHHFTADGTKYASRPVGTPYEGTAYAVNLSPETLLVTVDTFAKHDGAVHTHLTSDQLSWLRGTIEQARAGGVKNVIVQGHVSVLGPVNHQYSSNLMYEGGGGSTFWRILKGHDVDLYLAGEAHDMTVHTDGTLVQVTHGGYVARGISNYLLIKIYQDRIDLELKRFSGRTLDETNKLWQIDNRRPPWSQVIDPGPTSVGTMTIDKSTGASVLRNRTGKFVE